MSIQETHSDGSNDELVRLPGLWSLLAKVAIALSVPATMALIGLLSWVVVTIFSHDTRIAILESRLHDRGSSTSQSVNVGAAESTAALPVNWPEVLRRGGYTTAEFAKLTDKSQSWVRGEIEAGRLVAHRLNGKDWLVELSEFAVPAQFAPKNTNLAQSAPAVEP